LLKPIDHVHVKIERAKEHIHDFNARLAVFKKSCPYPVITEEDPQTGDIVFRVRIKSEIPLSCAAILGDGIQNLRSALDHLAYQLVLANGSTPTRRTAFPISTDAKKYELYARGKVKGMKKTAVDKIDFLQPYHLDPA
jgi:hypothetical protein